MALHMLVLVYQK